MVTYTYRLGYVGYFQIPSELITFSLSDIFVAVVALTIFASCLLNLGSMPYMVFQAFLLHDPRLGALVRRLTLPFVFFLIGAGIVILFPTLRGFWWIWLVIVLALVAFEFVLARRAPTDGSYLDKLDRVDQRARLANREAKTLVEEALRLLGPRAGLVIAAAIVLAYTAWGVGRFQAINQRSFYVTNTSPEAAVVLVAQEYVVCLPFERSSREALPAFLVLRTGESPGLTLTLQEIGPLHPRPPSKGTTSAPVLTPTPLPNQP